MGFFQKKIGPVFVKEDSDTTEYIKKLEALREKAGDTVKQEIEKQIKYARYGEIGEKNIAFELKSSGMDMMILHDLHLEAGDVPAQIDYLVITRQCIFVIECKNLYGNIKIDNKGTFIRLLGAGKEKAIYSPITQNERHLKIIKAVRAKTKSALQKASFEKNFEANYRSIVVLANPETVLYDRYAPKEIKQKVIRYDTLIEYIRKTNEESKLSTLSVDFMKELAAFFKNESIPAKSDYSLKYQKFIENTEGGREVQEEAAKPVLTESKPDQTDLIQALKEYRLTQSRENKLKPYYIFNDATMHDLLEKMPGSREELLKVSGFGPAKIEKYGDDLLKIISDHR